jgi:hypothetical protein
LPSQISNLPLSVTGDVISEYVEKWSDTPGPNFPNIAIGVAPELGGKTFRLAVRVQDDQLELNAVAKLIAEMTDDAPDIQYIGPATALATHQQSRQRPMEPGLSICHMLGGTGTLGCVVEDLLGGEELLLSNNHIFANENKGVSGDNIFQPGSGDGGTVIDISASLVRFEPIVFGGNNEIDAALARCNGTHCSTQPTGAGVRFSGNARAAPLSKGVPVRKVGRSTSLTNSTISAIGVRNIHVSFKSGTAIFDNQIEVQPTANGDFARDGDSGSLIIDDAGDAVALLFAVTKSKVTYGNPIATVLSKMGIRLK